MLDNNVNKQKQQNTQFQAMTPQAQQQQQVAMQAVNPDLLKENIQDSYVANRVANTTDDPKAMMGTAALTIPSWLLLSQGMDYFAKKSRGPYEQSLQYKIGNSCDKIVDNINNSSFGKSGFFQGLKKGVNNCKAFVRDKIVNKSRVLRAFRDTPSKPEFSMVLHQAGGMPTLQAADYDYHAKAFLKRLKSVKDLDCYGGQAADIQKYENLIKNASTAQEKALLLEKAEFECLTKYSNKNPLSGAKLDNAVQKFATLTKEQRANVLKNLKSVQWGFKDYKTLEKVLESTHTHIPEILEGCHKANPKMFARIYGSNNSQLGKIQTRLVGREVYASETLNKLMGEFGNINLAENPKLRDALNRTGLIDKLPKSAFAKGVNKWFHLLMEGGTNRVAGGKLAAMMQAWFLAEAIYKSAKAEGGLGEKGKTFAERLTELVMMFACIPISIQMMHKLGGIQYAGLDKAGVEAYRNALKLHNETAMKGLFANKAEWKASRDNLRKMLNGNVKNPFVKLFKKAARILTVGLEQIRPYDAKDIGTVAADGTKTYRQGIGAKLKDLWRHKKFGFKQMAGYPMRFIFCMAAIMPIFSKLAIKGTHLIFGKPKNSLLDEDKREKEAEALAQQQQQTGFDPARTELPPQLQNPQAVKKTPDTYVQNTSDTNLLNKYRNQAPASANNPPRTYIPSPEGFKPNNEPVRTYVPSPMGVQLTMGEDATAADAAMRNADLAEQIALQTLRMN